MASLTLSPTVTPVASTSVTCTLPNPLPPAVAGGFIAQIFVAPTTWRGTLALSGTNAGSFALSDNNNLIAGPNGLPAGSYSVTITATP